MEKIYENISTEHSTDFFKNFNSLEPKEELDEVFGQVYFSSAKSMGTVKHPHYEFDSTSKDESVFKENYGNPLCAVHHRRRILSIERTEEKVSIKLFYYGRDRRVGKPYFVKSTSMYFLTYNYKTNSMYSGSLINYHKKRRCIKRLRRSTLCEDPVIQFKHRIDEYFNGSIFGNGMVSFEKFDSSIPIKMFVDAIPTIAEIDEEGPDYTLYKHFLVSGGVKLPNNWKCLIEAYPQPRKIEYKKVGYKYVDAFMLMRDMKGDKLKRVLHRVTSFNQTSYQFAVTFFGMDYLLSRPDNEVELILDNKTHFNEFCGEILFNKTELKNIYQIYLLVCRGGVDYSTFMDHIVFKTKILKYQDIKWKSNTLDKFNDEHVEWSDIIAGYTDGIFTRRYDSRFINTMSELIFDDGVKFSPVVLTNTSEYNDESSVQSNCVRTYIDKPECFIVSLRKDDGQRLTVEYITEANKDEKITLRRIQTKEKFNKMPDSSWDVALRILDDRINNLVSRGYYSLPEKDVVYTLGLATHSKGIIYNTGYFNTIMWDDVAERQHTYQFWDEDVDGDLPL